MTGGDKSTFTTFILFFISFISRAGNDLAT